MDPARSERTTEIFPKEKYRSRSFGGGQAFAGARYEKAWPEKDEVRYRAGCTKSTT